MGSLKSVRAERSHILILEAPVEEVFPLFDPINEKEWEAGWDFKAVFPNPAEVVEGFVFTTQQGQDRPDTVWVLARFDKANHAIEYVKFEPDAKVIQIKIQCTIHTQGKTEARVTYVQTGLTEEGNASVEEFTEEYYRQWMAHWQEAINHYFRTGQTLQ